jgi:hypothetical protein
MTVEVTQKICTTTEYRIKQEQIESILRIELGLTNPVFDWDNSDLTIYETKEETKRLD